MTVGIQYVYPKLATFRKYSSVIIYNFGFDSYFHVFIYNFGFKSYYHVAIFAAVTLLNPQHEIFVLGSGSLRPNFYKNYIKCTKSAKNFRRHNLKIWLHSYRSYGLNMAVMPI